jgi:phosphoglycolate phosphatase-like HAD superfamily hydrolase
MKPLYIFDLDGTLADTEHRLHFIQGEQKDWRGFFAASVNDAPIRSGVETFKALSKTAECWIWTGRSDEVREQTISWLQEHRLFHPFWSPIGKMLAAPERFRMRKAGDYRPDHVIKSEWLYEIEPPEYDRLTAVFEDRARVVEMWRGAGVPCFQVAPGEF